MVSGSARENVSRPRRMGHFRWSAILVALLACSEGGTEPEASLVFDNQSGIIIAAARYVTCSSTTGYGPNRLSSDLLPGRRASFGVTPDCWDLQVTYHGGAKREKYGVDVSAGETKVWSIPPYP